jgi:hypothetical protein
MSRTKQNEILVGEIFKPDIETGESEWVDRVEIDKTGLKLGRNGNIRQNTPWTDKYCWEVERNNNKPTGKPLRFRTTGFSNKKIKKHPIRGDIRVNLLEKYKCLHCGTHTNLIIDHKNDMYNDDRVLEKETQSEGDFQVLCNKCNKDLKHQVNVREKKTGKLHLVRELNIFPFIKDTFDYPWEKCIRNYDESIEYCKMYTYWYDVEEFNRKRDIFVTVTRPINRYILIKVKLVP